MMRYLMANPENRKRKGTLTLYGVDASPRWGFSVFTESHEAHCHASGTAMVFGGPVKVMTLKFKYVGSEVTKEYE